MSKFPRRHFEATALQTLLLFHLNWSFRNDYNNLCLFSCTGFHLSIDHILYLTWKRRSLCFPRCSNVHFPNWFPIIRCTLVFLLTIYITATCTESLSQSMSFPDNSASPSNRIRYRCFLQYSVWMHLRFSATWTNAPLHLPYCVTNAIQLFTIMGTSFLLSCWSSNTLPSVPAAFSIALCQTVKSNFVCPWMYNVLQSGRGGYFEKSNKREEQRQHLPASVKTMWLISCKCTNANRSKQLAIIKTDVTFFF